MQSDRLSSKHLQQLTGRSFTDIPQFTLLSWIYFTGVSCHRHLCEDAFDVERFYFSVLQSCADVIRSYSKCHYMHCMK